MSVNEWRAQEALPRSDSPMYCSAWECHASRISRYAMQSDDHDADLPF